MTSILKNTIAVLGFFQLLINAVDGEPDRLVDCLANRGVPITAVSVPLDPLNRRLIYTPAAVVRASTPQHVSDAVGCASSTNTKVQAMSGGHSYGSFSSGGKDGSLVIQLEALEEISIDIATGIAKVGSGVRLGNLALGLFDQGRRAIPHGTCPGVGIGGHASHGGYGFSSRNWGLTLDTIVALDVVLANGSYIHTTNTSYPEIYFALRGAADSFGIITTFYLQTQPAPSTLTNVLFVLSTLLDSKERAVDAFLHLQNFAQNASVLDRRFTFSVRLNQTYFGIEGVFFGSPDEFNQKISPELLRGLPTPDPTGSNVTEYDWIGSLAAVGGPLRIPVGLYNLHANIYSKSIVTQESKPLTRAAVESYFDYVIKQGRSFPVPWYSIIMLYGGPDSEINAPSESFAAFSHRSTLWVFENFAYSFTNQTFGAKELAFIDGLNSAVTDAQPDGDFGAYSNYVDPRLSAQEAHRLYYGKPLYDKLLSIKNQVDPKAIFWNPQAIGVE